LSRQWSGQLKRHPPKYLQLKRRRLKNRLPNNCQLRKRRLLKEISK
jgi:hypothetical protein